MSSDVTLYCVTWCQTPYSRPGQYVGAQDGAAWVEEDLRDEGAHYVSAVQFNASDLARVGLEEWNLAYASGELDLDEGQLDTEQAETLSAARRAGPEYVRAWVHRQTTDPDQADRWLEQLGVAS